MLLRYLEHRYAYNNDRMTDNQSQLGTQSVEIASTLLVALAELAGPSALTAIADKAGMHRSKAHRYLVSLCRTGLTQQLPDSRYSLGPLALRLGAAALASLNPVTVATGQLDDLSDSLEQLVALAVWGDRGPTYVTWRARRAPVSLHLRLGMTMPLTTSAVGRLFAAYLPSERTLQTITTELQAQAQQRGVTLRQTRVEFNKLLTAVRSHGIARVSGDFLKGISGFSAPVFDHNGSIALALTTIAPSGGFDERYEGRIARTLSAVAQSLTRQLGGKAA